MSEEPRGGVADGGVKPGDGSHGPDKKQAELPCLSPGGTLKT